MTIDPAVRHRALEDMGREVTVYNYSHDGSTDDYGDPTGYTESSTDTFAIIEQSQDPEQAGGMEGQDLEVEVRIYVPHDVEVHIGDERDSVKATEIYDKEAGKRYKVFDDWYDHSGLNMLLCRSTG